MDCDFDQNNELERIEDDIQEEQTDQMVDERLVQIESEWSNEADQNRRDERQNPVHVSERLIVRIASHRIA